MSYDDWLARPYEYPDQNAQYEERCCICGEIMADCYCCPQCGESGENCECGDET